MNIPKSTTLFRSLIALLLLQACPVTGQEQPSAAKKPGKASVDARIARQKNRIEKALKSGSITPDQSEDLRRSVLEIESRVKAMRTANDGKLKPEELTEIKNSLNQSSNMIKSIAESGTHKAQPGRVLGPAWKQGADGGQDPKKLMKGMKRESRRERRQEKQALEQKIEQQQLQYEKEMVESLSEQKEDILKQKQELQDVRKESGAD
ncbi:MAG: hypothetical protein IPM23_24700 [Candidatus Melainabacteria bacterium]|nr:hypothetical protein [Candidatus Melainabacteria bacterium]